MNINNDSRIDWIKEKINAALTPTTLHIIDQGWQHIGHAEEGAGHFKLIISSPKFEGQTLVQCHQLVYNALKGAIGKTIHALQIEIQR